MMAARSSRLGTRKAISLSGTTDSVSVNHLSNLSSSHVNFARWSASEYLKVRTVPAGLPKTPRRRGPSWSLSRAWHPVQRFSKSSLPWLLPANNGRTAHEAHVTRRAPPKAARTAAECRRITLGSPFRRPAMSPPPRGCGSGVQTERRRFRERPGVGRREPSWGRAPALLRALVAEKQ